MAFIKHEIADPRKIEEPWLVGLPKIWDDCNIHHLL